jgi:ABC-2 type transport system permease protein
MLMIGISSISFLASCIFNLGKYSFAVGGGIPMLFYIFNMLVSIGSSMDVEILVNFKYLTMITLYNPDTLIMALKDSKT